MPLWNASNIPEGFLTMHNTKPWVYAKIIVLKGILKYTAFLSQDGEVDFEMEIGAWEIGFSKPGQWHKVKPLSDDLEMVLEFYQEKSKGIQKIEQNFHKVFPDKNPHYEVELLSTFIDLKWKKVLDLGSGGWRNSLFLACNGAIVSAWDKNIDGLKSTQELADDQKLSLMTYQKNLNLTRVEENYDIVISTVVLQFLEANSAKKLIVSAQEHTNIGWYHVIITPISSPDVPCPIVFPNLPTYEEYLEWYQDWGIIQKDNYVGEFHVKDEKGNRVKARFLTLVARKK